MDNESFLKDIKSYYSSLKDFDIKENKLLYNGQKLSLKNISLSKLHDLYPGVFLEDPHHIFSIIYLLCLIPYINNLFKVDHFDELDKKYVDEYLNKYFELEHSYLDNNNVDSSIIFEIQRPILLSYDNEVKNKKLADYININLINKLNSSSGRQEGKGKKLVLTNPDYPKADEDEERLSNTEKAGFTSIIVISIIAMLTLLYFAIFIPI